MEKWLTPALDYIPRWLEFQMRTSEQPGCVIAIAHKDRIVLERAFGHADLAKGERLTPRHRFRVASHSKSFTAAGVMKLREQGKLKLDDAVGLYVEKLNPRIARTTLGQVLSHSAGIVRDGKDSGRFNDRRPFFSAEELMADLQTAPGDVSRHADTESRADSERPQRQAGPRPTRGDSRHLLDQRDRSCRRGRQHRPRPGAVLRPALAESPQEHPLGREPARDGPPAVAQPAFEP